MATEFVYIDELNRAFDSFGEEGAVIKRRSLRITKIGVTALWEAETPEEALECANKLREQANQLKANAIVSLGHRLDYVLSVVGDVESSLRQLRQGRAALPAPVYPVYPHQPPHMFAQMGVKMEEGAETDTDAEEDEEEDHDNQQEEQEEANPVGESPYTASSFSTAR